MCAKHGCYMEREFYICQSMDVTANNLQTSDKEQFGIFLAFWMRWRFTFVSFYSFSNRIPVVVVMQKSMPKVNIVI